MRVAVLGGGLQGCCIALALAEKKGVDVTLFDRNPILMSRTAIANEGKVHLGYMYANDPSLATASTMMRGALAFAPFFERRLGLSPAHLAVSIPAAYVVHRDSQPDREHVSRYFHSVHALILEAAVGRRDAYFGTPVDKAPRRWSASELEGTFDPAVALDAYDTPEVAINPVELAKLVRERLAQMPAIEVRSGQTVQATEQTDDGLRVATSGEDGPEHDRFDHVVNALWEGRFAIDATMGLRPLRPWLHRLKYGVSFRQITGPRPPSVTIISGPFGEVVTYDDDLTYITWYPECVQGISTDISPPEWATYPEEPLRSRIVRGCLAGLSEIVPALRSLVVEDLSELVVKGGAIVAWGETDITDRTSELHRRSEIGVTSVGRYHSVDPGKLTMAPYFAEICADRIGGDAAS